MCNYFYRYPQKTLFKLTYKKIRENERILTIRKEIVLHARALTHARTHARTHAHTHTHTHTHAIVEPALDCYLESV